MIRRWQVSRFKSVLDDANLEFAPLTLFTGANSSGKSTIIQSILLAAQTIQSPATNRPIVLNGHLARLGSFAEVLAQGSQESLIGVSFDLSFGDEAVELTPVSRISRRSNWRHWYAGSRGSVTCEFSFGTRKQANARESSYSQPDVLRSRIVATVSRESGTDVHDEIEITKLHGEWKARAVELGLIPANLNPQQAEALDYQVQVKGTHQGRIRGQPSGVPVGTGLMHFLPRWLSVSYDLVENEAERAVEILTGSGPRTHDANASNGMNWSDDLVELISTEVVTVLEEMSASDRVQDRARDRWQRFLATRLVPDYLEFFSGLPISSRSAVSERMRMQVEEIRRIVINGRSPRNDLYLSPLSQTLETAMMVVQQFLGSSLKYLGPLRDEPKPLYPIAGSSDPEDIGVRGEHTAAVLHLHQGTRIDYIPSEVFNDSTAKVRVKSETLLGSVRDWIRYMGVGSNVESGDSGNLGHRLQIATTDEDSMHDLTQVGVGVSQVLPILVLALLAESGDTLIFEQPELHLHPRVQSRLADFFVSMTLLGKQCIVETHSDFLINRLRYRAAVADDDSVAKSVIMYFVEKQGLRSSYRPVRISEFGVIADWPRGFFDESEALAADILRAGMRKRRVGRE